MKLHLSNPAGLNVFTAYGPDYVAVNLEKYEKNLIVLPESIVPEWSSAKPATLAANDMQVQNIQVEDRMAGYNANQTPEDTRFVLTEDLLVKSAEVQKLAA